MFTFTIRQYSLECKIYPSKDHETWVLFGLVINTAHWLLLSGPDIAEELFIWRSTTTSHEFTEDITIRDKVCQWLVLDITIRDKVCQWLVLDITIRDKVCQWLVLDITIRDKVCQWLTTGRWFSPGTTVSPSNKTYRYDITELLLKVALNTITITLIHWSYTSN
jgi:hypothetical protein